MNRCPRCEGADLEECCELQEASDRSESFPASHRCKKCHAAFRYTPPDVTPAKEKHT